MRLLFDVECDGFLNVATKIHCIAAVNVDTELRYVWGPNDLDKAVETLSKATALIAHNGQRFDVPVLEKLTSFRFNYDTQEMIDTMIVARVVFPNLHDTDAELVRRSQLPAKGADGKKLIGSHKLEAWGYRLGCPKSVYDGGWEEWSQAMQDYCVQDIETNLKLFKHLKLDKQSADAIMLEHQITDLCDKIEQAGIPFDQEAAGALHAELIAKKNVVETQLLSQFGSWQAPVSPKEAKTPFVPKKDNVKLGYKKGVPTVRMKTVEFNPGSRDHIAYVLKQRGWKPTLFTDGGKAKIDENVVAEIVSTYPEMAGLADFLMLEKRLSQLADGKQAWMKHVGADGHIHGAINPMGAVTSRASHFNPNISQVPNAASPYGKECRALFFVPKGWKLVGADMQGLELRALAHYLAKHDGGAYAKVVTTGDPHWLHAKALGLASGPFDKHSDLHTIIREDGSKRFIYAYIYGAWYEMVGSIIFNCLDKARKVPGGEELYAKVFGKIANLKKVGARIHEQFAAAIPGFNKLKETLADLVEARGYIPGLDGRRIPTRSSHSALNFLLQSCGAILCKRWLVNAHDRLLTKYKWGWDGDFVFIIWNHDEVQVAVRDGLENDIGEIIVDEARKAGVPYALRVPLDSKYKVGTNWSETH